MQGIIFITSNKWPKHEGIFTPVSRDDITCILPMSHVFPVHPASQVQVYVNNLSVQSPLTQGPGMQ